jgi:hypothetical protein
MDHFSDLFKACRGAFHQQRTWQRAFDLSYGVLNNLGRSTITGFLTASDQQFKDWSAAYRLFWEQRIDFNHIFGVIRQEIVQMIDQDQQHIYAHMDDTLLRKTGRHIFGAKWLRDPLGPPFRTNLIWGQRFIQISLSAVSRMQPAQALNIPVDLHHCPSPVKPKKNDSQPQHDQYREVRHKTRLSAVGAERIKVLRANLDQQGQSDRTLVMSVDGSYTNDTVIKSLPQRVVLIGRIRKDAKFYSLPTSDHPRSSKGRKVVYGKALPTPEQIRQSDEYDWQTVKAWAAGKTHDFNIKTIESVRWRKTGERNLRLIVLKAVGYRLTQKSALLYRQPAYLICTDPTMSVESVLQAYLWRWGIEVNFRDQKTLLGCGQTQVRKEAACEKVPQFITAIYAMILLAGLKTTSSQMPRPKWYSKQKNQRRTTQDLINEFRAQTWADSVKIDYEDFVNIEQQQRSTKKSSKSRFSSFFYARN